MAALVLLLLQEWRGEEVEPLRRLERVATLEGAEGEVLCVALSETRVAAGDSTGHVLVWARSGALRWRASASRDPVRGLAWDGGDLLTLDAAGLIRRWDADGRAVRYEASDATSLAEDGDRWTDGGVTIRSSDGSLIEWDPGFAPARLDWGGGHRALLAASGRSAAAWNRRRETTVLTATFEGEVGAIAMGATSETLAGAWGGVVEVHDRTGRIARWAGSPATALAYSRGGRAVFVGEETGATAIYDLAVGVRIHALGGHGGAVRTIDSAAGNALVVTGGADGLVNLWAPRTPPWREIGRHDARIVDAST